MWKSRVLSEPVNGLSTMANVCQRFPNRFGSTNLAGIKLPEDHVELDLDLHDGTRLKEAGRWRALIYS